MIEEFILWTAQNQSLITLFFTAIVAMSTAVYAVLTWRLVKETKMMRESQIEPRISISLEPDDGFFGFIYLKIENVGIGPAYNVKLDLKPDYEYEPGKFLSKMSFIENGISYLSPKQQIKFFLTTILEQEGDKIAPEFGIRIGYSDCLGMAHEDQIWCDISHFKDMRQWGKPALNKIAMSLDKIEKKMKR